MTLTRLARSGLVALLLSMAAVSPMSAATLLGDVNGDGAVNISDALATLRYSAALTKSMDNFAAADVAPHHLGGGFGDGKINIADVVGVLRLVVGIDKQSEATDGQAGPEPPIFLPSIQFNISTPRGAYGMEDAIPFLVTLRNNTEKEATFNITNGCEIDLTVTHESGAVGFHPTDVCTALAGSFTLKPGEARKWEYKWDGVDPRSERPQTRQYGTWKAVVTFPGNEVQPSSLTFQVKENDTPVPLPPGPVTFDLTPGHADHYVNARTADEEKIAYLRYVKRNEQVYTAVSATPDSPQEALLRLDADNNLIQMLDGKEAIRLKLNATVGDKWTFGDAKVALKDRNATLKTPGGVYEHLLLFDFEVGPDAGWSEWVHPRGFWAGYSRNTIAGPQTYGITNRDGIGVGIPNGADYGMILRPDAACVKPGATLQLNPIVVDKTGHIVPPPFPLTWSVDVALGTVDQNGLFTATSATAPVKGQVRADMTTPSGAVISALATVKVTTEPENEPGESGGGGPPHPPMPHENAWITPQYAHLLPAAQQQFELHLHNENGSDNPNSSDNPNRSDNPNSSDNPNGPTGGPQGPTDPAPPITVTWSVDAALGTVDAHGLFTAVADEKTGVWGLLTAEAKLGDGSVKAATKVYVGPDVTPDPTHPPLYRVEITPDPAFVEPGGKVEFKANVITPLASMPNYKLVWSLDGDTNVGALTEGGVFTAGMMKGAHGVVWVKVLSPDGSLLCQGSAKVIVGGSNPPPPPPQPEVRLAFLQGGSLKLDIPPTMNPTPTFRATIKGQMPNPAWEPLRVDVKVDGNTVYLYPHINRTKESALDVTAPYESTTIISGLHGGVTYTVIAVGEDEKLTGTIAP